MRILPVSRALASFIGPFEVKAVGGGDVNEMDIGVGEKTFPGHHERRLHARRHQDGFGRGI